MTTEDKVMYSIAAIVVLAIVVTLLGYTPTDANADLPAKANSGSLDARGSYCNTKNCRGNLYADTTDGDTDAIQNDFLQRSSCRNASR